MHYLSGLVNTLASVTLKMVSSFCSEYIVHFYHSLFTSSLVINVYSVIAVLRFSLLPYYRQHVLANVLFDILHEFVSTRIEWLHVNPF